MNFGWTAARVEVEVSACARSAIRERQGEKLSHRSSDVDAPLVTCGTCAKRTPGYVTTFEVPPAVVRMDRSAKEEGPEIGS